MAVLLSLLAALAYGVSDFVGGVAARRVAPLTVLLTSYPVGAVLMAALLPAFPGHLDGRVALFGVLGGICGIIGVTSLYRALAVAPMNVVSPVTAVLAAVVPVIVGVTTGDRPAVLAWAGVALGLVAVLLVSRSPATEGHHAVTASVIAISLLAGLGFGGYFVFLARAGDHSGLWPLVISRITSAVLIVPLAFAARSARPLPRRLVGIALVAGVLDASANLFFLLATRHGLLSLASVITSLYPAATVALASVVLRERTDTVQRLGLGLAAVAIVLITV